MELAIEKICHCIEIEKINKSSAFLPRFTTELHLKMFLASHFRSPAQPRPLHSETLGPPLIASVVPHHQTACVSHEARRAAAPSTAAS